MRGHGYDVYRGGHVTAGGSICMSLLTMDDWSPTYNISQILVTVHSA
jgi:ubiquitin-conjugating enzyme E2 Q